MNHFGYYVIYVTYDRPGYPGSGSITKPVWFNTIEQARGFIEGNGPLDERQEVQISQIVEVSGYKPSFH